MPQPVVVRGRVVLPSSVLQDGVVVAVGDRLTFAGTVPDAVAAGLGDLVAAVPASSAVVLPGLVDVHNHGGGGVSFPDALSADEALVAVAEHRRHGTTTMLASLVSAPRDVLLERARLLGGLAEAGEIAGIHAEGPFLSYERRGAHNPADLLPGDAGLVRELDAAARGHLVTMTIAPEVPGVLGVGGAAAALVEVGAVPSLGHTDGSTEQAEALVAQVAADLAPRRMTATHLFNGMRPLHHRSPGPVAACLAAAARDEMLVELVADGVHLDPATVRSVFGTLGPDRVLLVTDAMAAAGMADGAYELGPMSVTVRDGVARLTDPDDPDGGAIAGGTAHLLDVVRCTVAAGVPLADAVRSASTVPARLLGLSGEVGALVPGLRADLLVTDADLRPLRVLRAGRDV